MRHNFCRFILYPKDLALTFSWLFAIFNPVKDILILLQMGSKIPTSNQTREHYYIYSQIQISSFTMTNSKTDTAQVSNKLVSIRKGVLK